MTTLLIYATNSSGTMLAAELIRDVLQKLNHTVTMKRANAVKLQELKNYDLVILGSCTWERFEGKKRLDGQLQQHMYELQQKLSEEKVLLPGHRFAVFALGDSSYTKFAAAADHLVQLVNDVGGDLVGEPLKIDGWFFRPEKNEVILSEWARGLIKQAARHLQ